MRQDRDLDPFGSFNMRNSTFRTAARIGVFVAFAAWAAPGCIEPGPRINRVQTNLIDKSVFQGEWWFTHTVIDVSDDASWAIGQAGASAPWPGATASFDIASQSGVVGRIRWVIDENFLYAYRTNEIVVGSSSDARGPNFRGHPLAAYRILGHFDVRQEFNPTTGEPGNVVIESQDRRWYDRRFIRVDWSTNLVTWGLFGASLEIEQLFGTFRREPVALGITDTGNRDLPAEWAPQFVRVSEEQPCDPAGNDRGTCYRFYEEWPADQRDTVHYMSFVTQEIWTPLDCLGSLCNTSVTITVRDAFLRVPPLHEYAVETLANSEYDRFGIIRTESRTYLRGGADRSTVGRYCETDADCDPACADGTVACEVHCDTDRRLCVGGLVNEYGETDFLTYYRLRHNFYSDSLTDQECIADWQCSLRYPGLRCRGTTPDGRSCSMFGDNQSACQETPGCSWHPPSGGSVCDPFARRCTIPMQERPIRPVRYTLSAGYPPYLVRSAFEVVATWNEALMRGAREQRQGLSDARFGGEPTPPPPTGAPVPCQDRNPTEYCYCRGSFLSPEVDPGSRTCPHRTNWFVRPEERNEENPYRCWIEGPEDIEIPQSFADYEADAEGNGVIDVYEYRMVGPECMLVLEVNNCDRNPGQPCQQLGDLRYQFFNYVSGAGAGWCGVMQPNQDPHTGEAIISPVNMGGLCLDSISQQAINIWPVLRGEAPADPLFQGEEIREYFDRLGRVRQPIGIAPASVPGTVVGGPRPAIPVDLLAHFEHMVERVAPYVRDLHGPEARARILSDRVVRVQGTGLEHRLVDGIAAEAYAALAHPTDRRIARLSGGVGVTPGRLVPGRAARSVDDEVLDRVSPFREDFLDEITAERRRMQLLAQTGTCMLFKDEYQLMSQYGRYWANAFAGRPLGEARIRWAQAFHRAIMQHELGHGLGLEHNFAASLDRDHYQPPYFRLEDELPLPSIDRFDRNGDGSVTDAEANEWLQEFQRVRNERNLRGMGNWTASSTMDYAGDLSDIMDIGFYDRAAIYFNYFNLVETFEGDPRFSDPMTSRDGLLRSDRHGRDLWRWYRGGEQCRQDSDCPYAAGSSALAPGQVVYQRCVSNPRYSSIPIPCTEIADPEAARHCICSNFDEDMADYVAGAAYIEARDRDGDGRLDHYPVQYLFCSNPRLNDISWCNAFDAGESFLEVIANMRLAWEQSYPLAYFRRFRRPFYSGARSLRWVPDAAKIYQHLFFRYFYEPRFRSQRGPLGLADQYMASIEAMNFFAYLAELPDVGSYRLNSRTRVYERVGDTPGMPGTDFSLEPGQGFYTWSAYQEGLLGFFRLERAGTIFDKLIALRALTLRDWGLNFTIDERFFINFYDLFPVEMTELFGGYVIDDPSWYAPRVEIRDGRPVLTYLNLYRNSYGCSDPMTGNPRPCRGANSVAFPGTPVGGTSNDVLRVYAAIFALAEFPVFFDTTFEQRLAVFKLGNADGFDIPDVRPDGSPTCAFGTEPEDRIEPSHALCARPEDADYILYRSNRLHTTFVAVKARPRIEFNLEEEQLGFQLLYQMSRNQERIIELERLPMRTAAEEEELSQRRRILERNESFLETLIEVQRIFGITSWL